MKNISSQKTIKFLMLRKMAIPDWNRRKRVHITHHTQRRSSLTGHAAVLPLLESRQILEP